MIIAFEECQFVVDNKDGCYKKEIIINIRLSSKCVKMKMEFRVKMLLASV